MAIEDTIKAMSIGMAEQNRAEANRGKKVNQAGWVTHEQARKEARQTALTFIVWSIVISMTYGLLSKIFGKKIAALIMVVLAVIGMLWFNHNSNKNNEERLKQEAEKEQIQSQVAEYRDSIHARFEALLDYVRSEDLFDEDEKRSIVNHLRGMGVTSNCGLSTSFEEAKKEINAAYNRCYEFVKEKRDTAEVRKARERQIEAYKAEVSRKFEERLSQYEKMAPEGNVEIKSQIDYLRRGFEGKANTKGYNLTLEEAKRRIDEAYDYTISMLDQYIANRQNRR